MRRSVIVEEWRAEIKRDYLLRLVRLRWPSENCGPLEAMIGSMTDFQDLSRWFDAAATASSFEEFHTAVHS